MKLTKCEAGHFYDADKYTTCPHCGGGAQPGAPVQQGGPNDKTVGRVAGAGPTAGGPGVVGAGPNLTEKLDLTQDKKDDNSQGSSLRSAVQDAQKTVGIFNVGGKGASGAAQQPVVGWLVCIEGKDFGKDFSLRMGKNFIGRGQSMDVVLTDASVSREKHSIIVYEPKGNLFIIQAGESRELSYLNDSVVLSPQELKAYDEIKLGESTLVFVPLCNDKFKWEEKEEEEK